MNRRTTEGSTAVAETAPPQTPASALDGIEFTTPMLKLAKSVLGPFLRHAATCTEEACGCGLADAVQNLKQRETITQRYGSSE